MLTRQPITKRLPLFLILASFILPLVVSLSRDAIAEDKWTRSTNVLTPGRPIAVGAPFKIAISDRLVGPQTCSDGSCGPTSCTTPERPNPSIVEDLTCTGAPGCTGKQTAPDPWGSQQLAVEATGEGTATYSFRLRDLTGDVRDMSFKVHFLQPTTIDIVRRVDESPHGTTYAALPNQSFTWCARLLRGMEDVLFDADGLDVEGVSAQSIVNGREYIEGYSACRTFSFAKAGVADVTFAYGSSLKRTSKIKVMPTYRAKSIDVIAIPPTIAPNGRKEAVPIEVDAFENAASITTFTINSCNTTSYGGDREARYIPRITMDDGSIVLGAISFAVDPVTLVHLDSLRDDRGGLTPFFTVRPRSKTGNGMIHVKAGTIDHGIPLVVVGSCGDPIHPVEPVVVDGGGADDAEAGASSNDAGGDTDAGN